MRRSLYLLVPLLMVAACSAEGPAGDAAPPAATAGPAIKEFPVPEGAGPHDVAPAADGGVWFTAQHAGYLGHLDPRTGKVARVPLGDGSSPHGVITGPGGDAWVTDSGLNAIVQVDARTRRVSRYPLPESHPDANLNTAAFDRAGDLWFTGQNGVYGRVATATGEVRTYDAPGGSGPYGITATGDAVYYASLAGSHIARIDTGSGRAEMIRPPTEDQGARRVWADSRDRIWVSEYESGQLGRYDPGDGSWREWPVPGDSVAPYAVYVDEADTVWVSDTGGGRLLSFDPETERFTVVPGAAPSVRQIHGRPGEVWSAASGDDKLLLVRTSAGPRPG